jgi:hypothetical protein
MHLQPAQLQQGMLRVGFLSLRCLQGGDFLKRQVRIVVGLAQLTEPFSHGLTGRQARGQLDPSDLDEPFPWPLLSGRILIS